MTELISEEYLAQQRQMHASGTYGDSGKKWARTTIRLARQMGASSILDYGCGVGAMAARIKAEAPDLDVREFDPAVVGKDDAPAPADLVTCVDVLEHVEPEHLDGVLRHLRELTKNTCFVVIAMRLAGKKLPDGRNAHLVVEQSAWWREKLEAQFKLVDSRDHPGEWRVEMVPR